MRAFEGHVRSPEHRIGKIKSAITYIHSCMYVNCSRLYSFARHTDHHSRTMARKTKAEAEATREAIMDCAEQVFMDKGVARASLEEIARAAGVTRGAVYWHFRNKQDILHAMLERVRAPLGEMIDDRSEEHMSELQSRPHLVCRLLL